MKNARHHRKISARMTFPGQIERNVSLISHATHAKQLKAFSSDISIFAEGGRRFSTSDARASTQLSLVAARRQSRKINFCFDLLAALMKAIWRGTIIRRQHGEHNSHNAK
jgi:hypothetical protein